MSVQKKVCLNVSPTEERKSGTLFFVFQALKPFTRDLGRIIRRFSPKRKMKTAFQK